MRKALTLAIAIGIAFVALQGNFGARAQPWPSHIVAGVITTLPAANDSNAVVWLLTNTTGPLVIQNALTPDPTTPFQPSYAIDIGNFNYDWKTTDQALVAFEVIRGVNGHNGVNWTGSVNALMTNDNIQTMPNGALQQYPTVTTGKSLLQSWVNFTGLTDPNIRSYGVWRSTTPLVPGSWTRQGSVPQAAGALSYTQTVLSDNTYCYRINVEYRRDTAGTMTNGTTGSSEWGPSTCQNLVSPLVINSHYPRDAQIDIPVDAAPVIVFNKAINPATFVPTVTSPNGAAIPTFVNNPNATNTDMTMTHTTAFDQCGEYNIQIAAQDLFGNSLVSGPVPNPWHFFIVCPNPQVTATTPVNDATGVAKTSNLLITFSKDMDQAAGASDVIISPSVGTLTKTWPTARQLQVAHATDFTLGQRYNVRVVANDTGGAPLKEQYQWNFTANRAPTVTVTAPAAGTCFAKGDTATIDWTSTDETPILYLQNTLTYYSPTAGVGSIGTNTGGQTYAWPVQTGLQGTDFMANVSAMDNASDSGVGSSPVFTIDQIAPTGTSFPLTGATVPFPTSTQVTIYVNFSKNMAGPATVGAMTLSPSVTNTTSWTDASHLVITLTTTALTDYTITFNTGAKDACGVGNNLAQALAILIHVGGKQPKAPTLSAGDPSDTSVTLSWTAVTQYVDNSNIPGTYVVTYALYRGTSTTPVCAASTSLSCQDTGLTANTAYTYYVVAIVNNTQSAHSAPVTVTTKQTASADYTWLIILIIIIIIVVILALVLLARRKKPEEAPVEEMPPAEGAMAEEAPPSEEAPAEEAPIEETPPEGEAPPEGETPPEGGEGGEESPPPA